jgi:RNA polymerase sigma-70 factor (ECF subfamily)
MLQAGQDDDEAFGRLVEQYRGRVEEELRRRLGKGHVAEELTQEVFLRVYVARKRYLPTARFSTWLFTIVKNIARNEQRRMTIRRELQVDHWPEASCDRGILAGSSLLINDRPDQAVEAAEMRAMVRTAIGGLSARQRQAVVLNSLQSLSHEEVAARMATTPQAIKSLLSRARSNLRQMLEAYVEAA